VVAVVSAASSAGAVPGAPAPSRSDAAAAASAPPVAIAGTERTSVIPARAPTAKRSAAARLAPPAVCLVVGLAVGHLWLSPGRRSAPAPARDDRPVAAAPTSLASVVASAPVAPAPAAPVVPAPTAPVAGAPAAADEPATAQPAAGTAPKTTTVGEPVAGDSPAGCSARIVTEPLEAKIVWGGKVLGVSPLEHAQIPCGSAMVAIEHERYQPVTQLLNADPGKPVVLSLRLHRPPGTLVVTSAPAHAYVTVNDQMLGPAPRRLAAWRYEQVSIRATYPGYQPWTKKIYLKEPTTNVTAQLVPTGRADGKRAAPAR
jgi:PEGA domain-containing protein